MRNVFNRFMQEAIEAYQPNIAEVQEVRGGLVTMLAQQGMPIRASDVLMQAGQTLNFLESVFGRLAEGAEKRIAETYGKDWQQHRWDDDGNRLS